MRQDDWPSDRTNQEIRCPNLGDQLFSDRPNHQSFQPLAVRGSHHHKIWRPVLQGKAHQTGDDVVEPDDLSGTVRAVDSKKEFTGVGFVINTEVERALPRDADFLGDVTATSREGYKDSHMISPASRCFSSIIIRLCVDHGRPTREQVLFVRRLANGSRDDLVPN